MTEITSVKITNNLQEIAKVISEIEKCSAEIPLSFEEENALELSLDELLTNIISYGYADSETHEINIDMYLEDNSRGDGNAIVLKITDDGVEFNPLKKKEVNIDIPLEDKQIGGLGIHLVKRLMNELFYERADNKNILTIKKELNSIKEN